VTVRIVRAEPKDWRRYRPIRLRALTEETNAYASTLERELGYRPGDWQALLASGFTYLAIERRRVVGTATGWWDPAGAMHVVAMYVAPEARGRGLARQLLTRIRLIAVVRGADRLLLDVVAGNDGAHRAYLRYGFTPTGRTQAMERDARLVEVEMELVLPGPIGQTSVTDVGVFGRADLRLVPGGATDDDHD
jgi:GNAT superfamily N-acetyltransferase